MCGKYGGPAELAVFAGYLNVPPPFKNLPKGETYLPLQTVPVFARNSQGETVLKEMRWGLVPGYFTGHTNDWRAATVHARLETVTSTSSYESAWAKKRRVIFPMSRFYEKADGLAKRIGMKPGNIRIAVTRTDDLPLAVAGIYDFARTIDGPCLSAAMLTRAPGEHMGQYHEREPVVLAPEDWAAWLAGSDDIDLARPLLADQARITIAT